MKASPFNTCFLLISMIITGTLQFTANAGEYLYADYLVASLESGREIDMPVYAHFDAWVQGWDLDITLPDGLSITSVDPGPGMSIPYIDAEGIETYLTPSLIATEHGYSCHINTAGYWCPDWNEDQLVSYGSVKWEPGEYEMFTLHLRIDDYFNGGEIIFETTASSENDAREDVIITQGETVTYYSGVDIQRPDAPVIIYSNTDFNKWELLIQSVEGASIRSYIYVDDILVAQDVNFYIFDTSNYAYGYHSCRVLAAAEINGRLSDYVGAFFMFYLEKPTSHRPTYRVDITATEAVVKWTGYGDGDLYTYVNGERSVNPYNCQRQESEQQISISATIQNTESYNGSSYEKEIIIPPLGVNVAQTPTFKWNPKTRTVTATSEGNQVTMRIEANNGEPLNPITGESSITYTLQPTEIISSMTFIAYAYADGKITSPDAEFAVDASHSDIVSLSIGFPDFVNPMDYANMTLQIKNSENGQSHSCIITNNDTYRFSVATNTFWDITLYNKYGDILGYIDNVEVAKENVIVSFASLVKPQTVTMTVMTPYGQDVTDYAMIDWMDENGEILVQGHQILYLLEGTKISYNIRLSPELSMMYVVPGKTTYTVKDGTNNIVCQLTEILQTQLSGKVKDATTNQPMYGVSVSATQSFAGGNTKTLTVTTDNQGVYSLDGMSVPTTMSFAAQGYITQTLNCDTLMTGGSNVTMPDVTLHPITGAVVNVNLTYTPAHAEDEAPEVQNWYSDYNNVDYEVYNKTTGRTITSISVQYPQIVLMEDVNDGDVLELIASSRKNAFNPVKTAVTIESQKASATFNIVELGKLLASFYKNSNPLVTGILYDDNGKLVKTCDYKENILTLDDLEDGNYKLITMGKSDLFNTIYDFPEIDNTGLKAGVDYVLNTVEVNSGIVKRVAIVEVPFFDETKLYYTTSSTSFMVNKPSITTGNYLTFTGIIDFMDQYADKVSDVQLIVDLPESCLFYDNSVMAGSSTCSYLVENNRITIPLYNYADNVRFCAIPLLNGEYTSSAFVRFKLNGNTIIQPIGAANFSVKSLSISVPLTTEKSTITITGTTNGVCAVEIYDNDVKIGETTSLANGRWIVECELYEPYNLSTHDIYAKLKTKQGLELITETATCVYDKNTIEMWKVHMYYYGQELVFDYKNPCISSSNYYAYVPGYDTFTFRIDFTENDTSIVHNVFLYVKNSNNEWTVLNTTFDNHQNCWIANGVFNQYKLPINVAVTYQIDNDIVLPAEIMTQEIQKFSDSQDELNASFHEFESIVEQYQNAEDSGDYLVAEELLEEMSSYLGLGEIEIPYEYYDDDEYQRILAEAVALDDSLKIVCANLLNLTLYDETVSDYLNNCQIDHTHGLSVEQLLANGYEAVRKTDGTYCYILYGDNIIKFVDFATDVYITVNQYDLLLSMKASSGEQWLERIAYYTDKIKSGAELIQRLLDELVKRLEEAVLAYRIENSIANEIYRENLALGYDRSLPSMMELRKTIKSSNTRLVRSRAILDWVNKHLKQLMSGTTKASRIAGKSFTIFGMIQDGMDAYNNLSKLIQFMGNLKSPCIEAISATEDLRASVDNWIYKTGAFYVTKLCANLAEIGSVGAGIAAFIPSGGMSSAAIGAAIALIGANVLASVIFEKRFNNNYANFVNRKNGLNKYCKNDDPEPYPDPDFYPGPDIMPEIDPSGFVYEGVPSNRLQGVTATCYYKETVEDMYGDQHEEVVLWDAEQYGQENPLLTDENGYYRWDVPIGMWQVKYEKAGYETTYSDWLPVPPPQLDVNIGMVQMRQPEVMKAHAYPKVVELEFDKFMFPETLTTDNISVLVNGSAVSGTIELMNAEKDDPLAITSIRRAPGTGLTFASRVRFNANQPFNAEQVTLHVNREVESYAGLQMNDDYEVVLDIELEMQKIVADSVAVVPYLGSKQLTVAVLPPTASAGKVINVVSTSPMIASIDAEQYTLDSNGEVVITVYGDLPGMTSLLYSIDGYGLTAATLVNVMMESQMTVATPTASIASGSEVEKGTEVYLYCKTPGVTIYYTLDASCPCDPTPACMVYDGNPIIINSTMTIKAMATAPDLYDSDVATYVYHVKSGVKGDVNRDGEVNIADVNAVIDVILDGSVSTELIKRADVNGDNEVNIADINAVIDIILNPASKMSNKVNCDDLLHVNGVTMRLGDVRTLDVTVDHAERYSALQCDIVLPEGLILVGVNGTNGHESRIYEVNKDISRALTYSSSKRPFMGESVPALSITVRADGTLVAESQIMLTNVVLSDADNVAWHLADCVAGVNNASGIHDLSVDNHDRVWVEGHAICIETRQGGVAHVTTVNGIVHDVAVAQGVNRIEFEPGIYVVVLNGESYKIVVK